MHAFLVQNFGSKNHKAVFWVWNFGTKKFVKKHAHKTLTKLTYGCHDHLETENEIINLALKGSYHKPQLDVTLKS